MPSLVHFYSSDDTSSIGDSFTGPEVTGSSRAKATGAIGIRIASISDFNFELGNLKKSGTSIDRMVVETHGSAGAIYIGNNRLDSSGLTVLKGKGYEDLFVDDARIFLNGCNIAESGCSSGSCSTGGDGRKFLTDLAQIFLKKGGGRVGASTSKGIPFLNSKVYHLWGDTVYAYINKGGTKVRIAAGTELASPGGQWSVTADGADYDYTFVTATKKVFWEEDKTFGAKSGQGTWQMTSGSLKISWESGSTEDWDLPLFTGEETGTWRRKDGATFTILAKKLRDGRLID